MTLDMKNNRDLMMGAIIILIAVFLTILAANVKPVDQTFDDLIGGGNHEDSLSTPWPGSSCPCGYPGCDCPSDNGIAITLLPTEVISPLPPIGAVSTPAIPIGVTAFATNTAHPTIVFPPTSQPIGPTPGPTLAGPTPELPDDFGSVPRPTH